MQIFVNFSFQKGGFSVKQIPREAIPWVKENQRDSPFEASAIDVCAFFLPCKGWMENLKGEN